GGYAGLSAALHLARGGARVAVLEARQFGWGASGRNAGMVSGGNYLGKGLKGLSDGEVTALLAEASAALDVLEETVAKEQIACHYRRAGRVVAAAAPAHYDAMAKGLDRLNSHAKAEASMLSADAQRSEIGTDSYFGGMLVNRTGTIHPSLYLHGLLRAAEMAGASLHSGAEVISLAGKRGHFTLETARETVTAREIVVATNGETGKLTPQFRRRVIPVASYLV